ncbi:alpha/beta hydrolase [Roseicyclus persicicus]|uniref:Alpha/beta hydrolase n=1 Tax=Roseicyclus persicicus TaxID=2650661 RepID=A0A7X6H1C5_9RHOB|nr:alpha/beta hydrolase [Roseibacterium persicicum]NKX45368.1 alpha/beta hydrolase [Roseibacterium persicicum]
MPLFATRRAYNASTRRFTHNRASLTRYVSVPEGVSPDGDHVVDAATWLSLVKGQAGAGEILIYVHGFNTEQAEMLERRRRIELGLAAEGWQGLVLSWDWPSDGTVWAYLSDRTDAKHTAPHLVVDAIGPLLNLRPQLRVHLLCHSMGAYLTLRGFSGVGDSGAPGSTPWGVHEVAFVSADADKPWMEAGAWGALVMERRCARLTNYYSTFDRVLSLSEGLVHGAERAGRDGLPVAVPAPFHDVYCGAQYEAKVPASGKTLRGSHTWYFDDPGFYRDLAATLAGADPATMQTRRPVVGSSDLALLT